MYSNCCNSFAETLPEDSICPSCLQECEFERTDDIVLHKKTFLSPPRDRPVTIRIFKDTVSFHFPKEIDREFYWFGINDWKHPNSTWEEHMEHKIWFTGEMLDFINENI